MDIKLIQRIDAVNADEWNHVTGTTDPFVQHALLLALEKSLSVCRKTGWQPHHLLVYSDNHLIAVMPLYLKFHSQGEYVFDHLWANAYHNHQQSYYPKWLTSIPFTPCQGSRIIIKEGRDPSLITHAIFNYLQERAGHYHVSSWHCLFPHAEQAEQLKNLGLSIRLNFQFHWFNNNYRDFNDFLDTLRSKKRKQIKRERQRIAEQGIKLITVKGATITDQQWRYFYQFYQLTYLKKGHAPYLTFEFFKQISNTMPEQLLLVIAELNETPVAMALFFIGSDTLYGRYWGCQNEFSGLHFETCYYQGINYCIKNKLIRFDAGAQGEHKIARGFTPITTYSAHWIKDPQFSKAIHQFIQKEKTSQSSYEDYYQTLLPFKRKPPDTP